MNTFARGLCLQIDFLLFIPAYVTVQQMVEETDPMPSLTCCKLALDPHKIEHISAGKLTNVFPGTIYCLLFLVLS